jgi:hypothetical protein
MSDYQLSPLWKKAFFHQDDGWNTQRDVLVTAYTEFRKRVSLLVRQIHKDMPDLTVHDITHVDALWWTASEIAGLDYPLNPAEAFVLGGAFLLHDAAHCMAAYPGGVNEIRALPEWQDFAAKIGGEHGILAPGSEQFQLVLFDVLRTVHPKQARKLANIYWSPQGDSTQLYLLSHDDLRQAYADAIGRVAESHWSSPHELEELNDIRVTSPACLHPASWTVDILKLAVLLRTADAAHIDAQRSPRFLLALIRPGGSSLAHWQFQSRIHKVKRDPEPLRHDLCISGSPFPSSEQDAWWMAYDAARMIDNELRAADRLLLDLRGESFRLAARSVAFSYSPEAFAQNVPADGWHPIDTSIKITDIKSMVERFGGEKLYGKDPVMALRELLQNAVDAVHACRSLGGLGREEGEIEVAVEDVPEGHWLHVTDTGIGMSRYVLTEVLLDFGRSLWRSADLRGEWSGLSASGFEAIGQFGIGFFSVFMLGERVRVVTRRYESKEGESGQWLLEFTSGTNKRPILRVPTEDEILRRHGTRLSVLVSREKLLELLTKKQVLINDQSRLSFSQCCARLAPAIDIDLYVRTNSDDRQCIVKANDWLTLPPLELLQRINPTAYEKNDPKKFGKWMHLSEVQSESGVIVGRCAIQPFTFSSDIATGVVRGLYAGRIPGLSGVIFTKPQDDLARKSAIPDVSLVGVQRWAETQKKMLLEHGEINDGGSALLALFGVGHIGLTLGKLCGESVSYEEFVHAVRKLPSIMVHEGEVSHDDDDDVLWKEFKSDFEADEHLFETTRQDMPHWLGQIDGGYISRDSWSLQFAIEAALREAWGEVDWYEDSEIVGLVNGIDIMRSCKIASKRVDLEDL